MSTGSHNISTVSASLPMSNEWHFQRRSLEAEVVSTDTRLVLTAYVAGIEAMLEILLSRLEIKPTFA